MRILQRLRTITIGVGMIAAMTVTAMPQSANAALALTADGTALGFTLTTFAVTNPGLNGCCSGPFGLAVSSNGRVFVSDPGLRKVFSFNDVDGQTPATALLNINSNLGTSGATAVGNVFWSSDASGNFATYSSDLATITTQTVTGYTPRLGMATTPDGHVIATTDQGKIIEITPGNPVARVIVGASADGVSVSPDGTKIVAEVGGKVNVYSRSTGALLSSFSPNNQPDGTGVIAGSVLNDFIIAAGNNGTIVLIDPVNAVYKTIASGGTRLDYTTADSTNGTLLIDAADAVYRLSCRGCSIGSPPPPPAVPEPDVWTLMLAGFGIIGSVLRRQRFALGRAAV